MITVMQNLVNPIILEMHIKTETGGILIGQWFVLYDEIPVHKIGEDIYEVYPEGRIIELEEPHDRTGMLIEQLKDWDGSDKRILPFLEKEILPTPKYVKTSKGSKRMRPWEGPQYF